MICPECGWKQGQPAGSATGWLRWVQRMAWLIPCLFVLGLGIAMWLTRGSFGYTRGSAIATFVFPAYTRSEIQDIAAGKPHAGSLMAAMLESTRFSGIELWPGDFWVRVGFGPASSHRSDVWTIGWPLVWYSEQRYPVYEDSVKRTGWIPAKTDTTAKFANRWTAPRDYTAIPVQPAWYIDERGIANYPAPEDSGNVYTARMFFWSGPLLWLGLVMLGGALGALTALGFSILMGRAERRRPPRKGFAPGALVVGTLLVVCTILTAGDHSKFLIAEWSRLHHTGVWPGPQIAHRDDMYRLSRSRGELESTARESAADVRIAQEILRLTPADTDGYLTVWAEPRMIFKVDGQAGEIGSGWFALARISTETFIPHPDATGPAVRDHPLRIGLRNNALEIRWWPENPASDHVVLSISLPNLAILSVIPALGLLAHLIGRRIQQRIAERRARQRRCLRCGYDIAPRTS